MELSLDLCLAYVPRTVSELLRELSGIRDSSDKMVKLEDYVNRLEDEMRKIDAFKRELPLCMLLLNDAIGRLKEEAMQCTDSRDRAVVEKFLPLKVDSGEDEGGKEKDCVEKKNWMSSAQLWGRADGSCETKQQGSAPELNLRSEDENRSASDELIRLCNYRNIGVGAFVPFKAPLNEDKDVSQVSGLCLATPMPKLVSFTDKSKSGGGGRAGSGSPVFAEKLKMQSKQQLAALRKQRRCWSPELHRRFVDALQQLGGSKVATPKQIRELMQVDGLTNDEVKSHLQKYRLHIRKLPGCLTSSETENVSWMNKDQCGEHSEPNNSQSGSPQGPLFGGTSAKGISSNGDSSLEAEEDEKSEGHSWKGGLSNHNHSHRAAGEVNV